MGLFRNTGQPPRYDLSKPVSRREAKAIVRGFRQQGMTRAEILRAAVSPRRGRS